MHWADVLRHGDGVATVAELVAAGLSRGVVDSRVRGRSWQRVLPGVIVAHSGPLLVEDRYRAAVKFGGADALLSHRAAGELHGLRIAAPKAVDITVPHGRRRVDTGDVIVHQSNRNAAWIMRRGIRCTHIPRTVIDIAGQMSRLDDVRALISDVVQRRLTDVEELATELKVCPRRGSAHLREALGEIRGGVRSAGEGAFLRLVRRARLPEPELNARIQTSGGWFIVDALWRQYGVAVEIDGQSWHLDAESWQRDLGRQNLLHAAGIVLLRFPVIRLSSDPAGVVAELRATFNVRQEAS